MTGLRKGYRADIDGLRAIAILSVVMGHFFPSFVPGGFIGVDIFFVISGYLITGIVLKELHQNCFSFSRFYAHRFRRILPGLTIVLLTAWVIGFFILLDDELKSLGEHVSAAATFVSNILLWKETGYFDLAAELKPLLHLWSLGVEEQFYLAWPVLLVLFYRRNWPIEKLVGCAVLVSFLINVMYVKTHSSAVFYLLPFRFWELLVGGLLAYAEGKKTSSNFIFSANQMSLLAAALFFLSIIIVNNAKPYPGWWALLPVASALLLIAAGDKAWINRCILSSPPAVFVGLISYPLYLWHWPLLSFLRITENGDKSSLLLKMCLLFLAFVLAWLTYKWVDQPIKKRFFTDKWMDGNKGKFIFASLILILIITVLGIFTSKGRINSQKSQITATFVNTYANYANDKWSDAVRAGKCHLDTFSPADFDEICFGGNAPLTIALWGDSHSSHLYPGLRSYFGEDVSIMQFGRGCPPLSRFENDDTPLSAICIRSTALVMGALRKTKPDVLILAALWSNYYPADPLFIKKLNATILEAKSLGIKNIIVVGQVPTWRDRLYKLVTKNYLSKGETIPDRSIYGLEDHSVKQRELSQNFEKLPVHYLDIAQKLCNLDGCIIMVGSNPLTDLISFDNGHLTENGSKYVVANFLGPLIHDSIESPRKYLRNSLEY